MAIDPQFTKVVNYLKKVQGDVAGGVFGEGQRPWVNFDDVQVVGQFDLPGLMELFSRQASNNDYSNLRANKNSQIKELHTAKISADYLAGFQRDIGMRRRSRVRMLIHGANRSWANGLDTGPLQRNTTDWLSRMLSDDKEE